jgi:hypothetical protein
MEMSLKSAEVVVEQTKALEPPARANGSGMRDVLLQVARVVAVIASVVLADSAVLAETYKWTDSNGDIHFSETPQPGHTKANKPKVRRDAQKDYLNFMATYDQRWKNASAAERAALDRERKRLAQESSVALQDSSQSIPDGMLPRARQEYESLGAYELWQARWAAIQAQQEVRKANTEEELERARAEMQRREAAYERVLSQTSTEDRNQASRIEQRDRYRSP